MRYFRVAVVLLSVVASAHGQRQMENLGRGVVAVRTNSTTVYVGWRLLGTDPDGIGFNLYRATSGGGTVQLTTNRTQTTDFVDTGADLTKTNSYFVRPVINGIEQAPSASYVLPASAPIQQYISVPLQIPPGGTTPDNVSYTYNANDVSVGDLDGDGEYEIVLKWDPSNSKDNSQSGYTGNVFLDAYKLDGTLLWRIDLGINIRAGAHYTQFIVYDLDGDGKAEVACRTAPGTRDGLGNNVILPGDDPNADFRNASGYILTGPEYLTIFNGQTGAAMATTNFYPDRVNVSQWGDSYGNRVDRFLAAVAYLDGKRPSLIMLRGYYGPQSGFSARNEITAWNWRGGQLSRLWWFKAGLGINNNTNSNYIGEGNHNLTVADIDHDGKDEIIRGASVVDDDGEGFYATGLGHGDAIHVSDLDPDRPGLELWQPHEDPGSYGPYGLEFRDVGAGVPLWGVPATGDVGRGVAADIDPRYRGYEAWGSAGSGYFSATGTQISSSKPSQQNFAVWWDADLLRELLDGTTISKWNWLTGTASTLLSPPGVDSNNGTKATPCLSADILGDWREEVIWRASDNSALRIYTTVIPATNRFYTLMHDAQYREAIAWQNTAYNQPPHPGFFLGEGMNPPPVPLISDADLVWRGDASNAWDTATANWFVHGVWTGNISAVFSAGKSVLFDLSGSNSAPVSLVGTLTPAKVTVHSPKDYVFAGSGSLAGTATVVKAGTGTLTIHTTNTYTGATSVSDGALFVHGSLEASPVTVRGSLWGLGWVGGTGKLGGGLTAQAGASIVPGNGTNSAGTLTISNGLTVAGGVMLRFDLSHSPAGTNDLINVLGNVSFAGTNTIQVTLLNGPLGPGTYPLIQYTGTAGGALGSLLLSGASGVLTNLPGQIALLVLSNRPPANIVWAGDGVANHWDLTSSNWLNAGFPDVFVPLDNVIFNDAGSTNPAVNLVGALAPASIIVSASVHYTFAGSGSITNPATLTKLGPGKLTVATLNSFTNQTTVLGGTLQLGDGATANGSVGGNISNDASLIIANPDALTIPGNITGSGSLTKTGAGTLTLTGANNYTGPTIISNGALQVGSGGTSGALGSGNIVNNGLLAFNRSDNVTNGVVISGTGSLAQLGTGILMLGGSNSYSGGTTVGGVVRLLHNNAAGSGSITVSGSVQVGNGITIANTLNCSGSPDNVLDCASGTGIFVGNVAFASGGAQFRPGTTGGTLVLSNGTAAMGGRFFFVPRGTVTFAGNFNLTTTATGVGFGRADGFTVNVTLKDNASVSLGSCSMGNGRDMSSLRLTLRDAARLTLTDPSGGNLLDLLNTAGTGNTGTLTLNGGTLTAGGFVKTSVGSTLNSVMLFNGGVLKAANSSATFLDVLPGLSARVSTNGAKIDDGGFSITIAQPLNHDPSLGSAPDGGLIKLGSGTLTLTGTNGYTGPTVVSNGTLLVNNTVGAGIGTNTLTVAGGATLGGTGVIRAQVVVNGTLAPGSGGPGTLTVTNLVLNSGATMQYELGTASDLSVVSSNLTLAGTLNVTATTGFGPGSYTLFTYGKTLVNNGVAFGSMPAGYSYSLDTATAGQVRLIVTALSAFQQWQLDHFGCTNCPQAAGDFDFDGDGMSNTNEFLAGTNPTNAASAFQIISIGTQGEDVRIAWRTAVGKTNAVQASPNPVGSNYTDVTGPIIITDGDTTNSTHVGGATNTPAWYYRIRLVP